MKSKSNINSWLLLIIISLLALSGYLWYSNSELKGDLKEHSIELAELEQVQAELDKDYQIAMESIENLRDDNKNLDELIDSQKNELKAQKKKIDGLIWSKRELDKARTEIANIRKNTSEYISQIQNLKADNELLTESNLKLRGEKEDLSLSLIQEKSLTQDLTTQTDQLITVKKELEEQAVELSNKVAIGSAVKVNNLKVQGYQFKKDNTLKKKRRAKSIEVLRICFDTESNLVTTPGEDMFQVRYMDEKGETLLGDGKLKTILNLAVNQEVLYSTEGAINYNNKEMNGCIDWIVGTQLNHGKYEAEIYNKGYLVGKGEFKLHRF